MRLLESRNTLSSPTVRRLVRSYGLLVLLALGFLLLALFVREADETVPAESLRSVPAVAEVA